MIIAFKILAGLLLLVAVSLIVFASMEKASEKLKQRLKERKVSFAKREKNRYVSDYIDLRFAKTLDEIYKYSRIYKMKIGKNIQTSFDYFCLTIAASVVVTFFALILSKSVIPGLFAFALTFTCFYGFLFILKSKNKSNVGKDIELFLQLLGNYSTANTEIMSLFMQIAPQMREPLCSCLVECVAEAQNIENKKQNALENLVNKIEYEKFKEIIYSISVTEKYSGSFTSVVAFNKGSLQNFSKSQRKKKQIVRQNGVTLAFVTIILLISIALVGQLTGTNVWFVLTSTPVGQIVSGAVCLGLGYFIFKLIGFSA